jgi:HEAT repeat protein/cell wall assembly regulator SMI1
MIDWKHLLTDWSRQLMQTSLAADIEPSPDSNNWLGFKPATKRKIQKLEQRLGVKLPPSYTDFLRTSNGWRRTTPFIGRIRPAEEVEWFRVENEQWVEEYAQDGSKQPDTEYYVYSPEGAADHRAEHMSSLLQISDVEDGVYLLNPEAVTPDGEWEAWFFANWVPGAMRFPSFAHLMLREYRSFAELEEVELGDVPFPQLDVVLPEVPRTTAMQGRESADAEEKSKLEELIEEMGSLDDRLRAKAVRKLAGTLRGRPSATRKPELVEPLTHLFYASSDADVRAACVHALTELAEDGEAPTALIDALSDAEPGVILSGIFALTYYPNDRALEPLCKFIESRRNVLFNENAVSQLGKMGNPKAVATLAGVLLDTNNEFDQSFSTAAIALSRCGQAGFDALSSALDHEDPRIRLAAVVGLDVSGKEEASVYLDRALTDPDESVRQRAKVRLGNLEF